MIRRKVLYCLLDGYGDVRYKELGGKTPLEYAETPFFDSLLANGKCGFMEPVGLGKEVPITDASAMTFSFLGYDVRKFPHGRGVIEAIGEGMAVKDGDFVARCNFATVSKDGTITDLRAGRIRDTKALATALNRMSFPVPFEFRATEGHRGIVVFKSGKGERFSEDITQVDPHAVGKKIMKARPLKPAAKGTAELLNLFVERSREVLGAHPSNGKRKARGLPPANAILPRGFSAKAPKLEPFRKRYGVTPCGVTGVAINKGICKLLGIPIIEVAEDMGDNAKEMATKRAPALAALHKCEFVFLHFKTIDLAGHDGDLWRKVSEIERTDAFLGSLSLGGAVVAIGADHCTPCKIKGHSAGLIPYLYGTAGARGKKKYGDSECAKGKHIKQYDFVRAVLRARA
ncbi:2,3-bisphosphoglycerate-independent phosphoglycerate mutase 1 [Candidatus Norongarragalina meridionalis]|nr:2,3-bisphosphoglycerate-independent phosphoglycerate mutase 1 [Candidatus Norongarragalina meridionalis]